MVNAKVFVGMPIYGNIPYEAADAFTQMVAGGFARNTIAGLIQSGHGVLSHARNNIIMEALKGDCSHILFVDSDMVPRRDTLAKLLVEDVDILSALYFMRQKPHLPVMTKRLPVRTMKDRMEISIEGYVTDYPKDAIIQVGAIGMGCALIKRTVFERIKEKNGDEKWFSFENNEGEDFFFCRRAAELGISCHVHTGAEVGHVANVVITEEDFLHRFKQQKAVTV